MLARLHSTLRGHTGQRAVDLDLPDGATVRQALAALVEQVPALDGLLLDVRGEMQPTIMVFRSGRNVDLLDGGDTTLQAGHVLDIFPRSHLQRVFATE